MILFQNKKTLARHLCLVFLITCVTECFVMNYRFWEARFFPPAEAAEIRMGEGIVREDDGTYLVADSNAAYMELLGIHAPVRNLYLDLFEPGADWPQSYPVRLEITDAANSEYLLLPETEIVRGIPESQYIRLHLTGNSEKIRVDILCGEGTPFVLSGLQINAGRPFLFHAWRFLLFLMIGILILAFRPSSPLYSVPFDLSSRKQLLLFSVFVLLHVGLFLLIGRCFYDHNWRAGPVSVFNVYNYQAESFLDGHSWLNIEPPAVLAELHNPYDKLQRLAALEGTGESYITDFAYRNGHYYCYYGVLPVILFYLPWLVLTGKWLSTGLLIIGISWVFLIAAFWLFYELLKKYFPSSSFGIYLLLGSVLVFGSAVLYAVQFSNVYALPFLLGLTLDALGLACWLRAAGKENIKKRWLAAGAVCIALTVGCRPQLAIAVLFAFPIFWQEIREGEFFSRKGLKNTLAVILPFLLIDCCFLYYNYIRFGSFLDFGATYNLTGFDMTHRSFLPAKFLLGFYEFFFQPFSVGVRFPYLQAVTNADWQIVSDYQGQIITEPMLGGFFAFNLIGLFLFGLHWAKPVLKEKGCYGLTLVSLVSGLLMAMIDIYIVGVNLRYFMDFSFFLMLPVLLIILALLERYRGNGQLHRLLFGAVVVLSFLCIGTNLMTLLAEGRFNSLDLARPGAYYALKYQLFSPFLIR